MTLQMINTRTKKEDEIVTTANVFKLGEHYEVRYTTYVYPNGKKFECISVDVIDEDIRNSFIPTITTNGWTTGDDKFEFKIQTTSYGSLEPQEIQKVIAGYQEAVEAVECLNKWFVGEDK